MTIALPEAFQNLQPFVADWALGTPSERQRRRLGSYTPQLRAFYEAIMPQMADILAFLDQYPLGELPEEHLGLYWLSLSLAEVAPHIELYRGDPGVPYAFEEARLISEIGHVVNR